ncbi:hypothetical protein ACFQGW_09450 [Xanthomonas theicola]|uniref:hypothetical protein n=1 Tax=Xanthomonas theicola TaxID=56464 RepID=UPI00163B1D95|nr:hypothetical protein [Xanthomonas theicola]QNH23507.1 hypothetical protein G4Q83_22155 [Xanthomonas theicola]
MTAEAADRTAVNDSETASVAAVRADPLETKEPGREPKPRLAAISCIQQRRPRRFRRLL